MSGLRRGKGLRKQDSLDLDAVLKEYESEPSEGKTPREQMDDIEEWSDDDVDASLSQLLSELSETGELNVAKRQKDDAKTKVNVNNFQETEELDTEKRRKSKSRAKRDNAIDGNSCRNSETDDSQSIASSIDTSRTQKKTRQKQMGYIRERAENVDGYKRAVKRIQESVDNEPTRTQRIVNNQSIFNESQEHTDSDVTNASAGKGKGNKKGKAKGPKKHVQINSQPLEIGDDMSEATLDSETMEKKVVETKTKGVVNKLASKKGFWKGKKKKKAEKEIEETEDETEDEDEVDGMEKEDTVEDADDGPVALCVLLIFRLCSKLPMGENVCSPNNIPHSFTVCL